MTRILSIAEAGRPVLGLHLPNGYYSGVWGGYVVKATIDGRYLEMRTEDGIRCPRADCTVFVRGDQVHVECD